MGEFIDHVRAAGSPTQQLKLLHAYRPPELGLGGASEEQWDAAVYTTLDRSTLLKRLLRGGDAGGGSAGLLTGFPSGGSSPVASTASGSNGSAAGSSAPGDAAAFGGPVVALLPRDRLGALMLEATRQALRRPAAPAPGQPEVAHVPLDTRHTECLLSEQGRRATAALLADAIRAVLPRL